MTSGSGKQDMLERVFEHHQAMSGAHTTSTGERRPSMAGHEAGSSGSAPSSSSITTASDLPCTRVKPISPGHVYWFADEAALAKVSKAYPRTPFDGAPSAVLPGADVQAADAKL